MSVAEKIVPAVSHRVAGPLGVTHLPRLWLKAILKATGRLADGWNSGYRGMDQFLIDDLAIASEPLFAFLNTVPNYSACEIWVRANAGAFDTAAIAAHNKRILNHNMTEQYGIPRRAELGFTNTSLWNAVLLNDLDDWNCLHAAVLQRRGTRLGPIVPLVSSQSVGLLGIKHLPRLWAKAIIYSIGALPEGRRSCAPGGLDAKTLENLGLDLRETHAYLLAEQPTYLEFERWVRAHAKRLDAALIAAHNAGPWDSRDDLEDWDAIRQQVFKRRTPSRAAPR